MRERVTNAPEDRFKSALLEIGMGRANLVAKGYE